MGHEVQRIRDNATAISNQAMLYLVANLEHGSIRVGLLDQPEWTPQFLDAMCGAPLTDATLLPHRRPFPR